jgi:acetyl esterase/lipase
MPHPAVESGVSYMDREKGSSSIVTTCLLSPWVNLRTEGSSVAAYKRFDCVDKGQLDQWMRAYLGPSGLLDCYNNPIDRTKNWKSILTQKTLFMAGGMELFLSDILELADRIRAVSFAFPMFFLLRGGS